MGSLGQLILIMELESIMKRCLPSCTRYLVVLVVIVLTVRESSHIVD